MNVYFYDGNHEYEIHKQGLEIILPYLADEAIILIDDLTFIGVNRANTEFMNEHKEFKELFRVRYKHKIIDGELKGMRDNNWGNGFMVIS